MTRKDLSKLEWYRHHQQELLDGIYVERIIWDLEDKEVSDKSAATKEITNNITRLKGNLISLECHPDWEAEKIIAAKQVLEIVAKFIEMAKK